MEMFQSLQSTRQKWSQLVILQEKPSKHRKAIESSVQSAQHVPLQIECYIAKGIIANIFENSIWKTAQAVVAEINFIEFPKGLKRPLFNRLQAIVAQVEFCQTTQIPNKTFWKCSQFVALQMKFAQAAESLKDSRWKEGLPTDSMPCWGSGGFPNCQKCVHRESSNWCWIGQGGVDVSIPSKPQAKMKSTCYPAGKAFAASQSHRKLRPMCSTCSLAVWVWQHSSHRHHCQHLWKFHLEDSSSGCCWDQFHGLSEGPEKTRFQPPPNQCSASRGNRGYWDSEKDLLEVFSICCPASQVVPDCWDSEKDLLEVFSICCPASQVFSDCWDSEKDLVEVFSICCPASQVFSDCWDSEKDLLEVFSICCLAKTKANPDAPSHRTLQQEAQSNSCFPNTRSRQTGRSHLDTMCWCHQ